MKTMKWQQNSHTGEEEIETIDLISADNEEDKLMNVLTEEPHFSDDDNHDSSKAGSIENTVEHVCGKCHKTFRTISNFKKHVDFCRFNSSYHVRKAEMLKNLEKIEKDAVIMENTNVCFCCGESYDTCHLGQIKCPDCPKSFKTQLSYERHIFITHAEFDDHSCSICNAKVRSVNLLKLHEEQHHNRNNPFTCNICGKRFARSNHVITHQKYSSCSSINTIKCKVCNKAFQRIGKLRDHLKQHLVSQTLKKSEYICPVCKKCFQTSYNLKVHSRIHTDERPFHCDLCAKKFRVLAALQSHRRSHTGEKPYACSVCNQSFSAKQSFNLHVKRHTGERRHVCRECGKNFIRLSQLRSHAKVHIRPYGCDECNKHFRTQKQLESHVKEHNKCDTCKMCFKTVAEYNKHLKENVHTTSAERYKRKNQTYKNNIDSEQSSQFHMIEANQRDTEIFVNENPSKNYMNDTVSISPPKIIKIQDSQGESFAFVTTNIEDLKQQHVLKTSDNEKVKKNSVGILDQGCPHTSAVGAKQAIFRSNEKSINVISFESDGDMVEQINTKTLPTIISPESKMEKNMTLAAAIADDEILETEMEPTHSEEDLKLNVRKLLDKLVDSATLKRFGWPNITEDIIVCKLIENCGYDLAKEQHKFSSFDYATRMREYVKLFLTVVIQNESIEELLNNDLVDEVIEYVLCIEDDGDIQVVKREY